MEAQVDIEGYEEIKGHFGGSASKRNFATKTAAEEMFDDDLDEKDAEQVIDTNRKTKKRTRKLLRKKLAPSPYSGF